MCSSDSRLQPGTIDDSMSTFDAVGRIMHSRVFAWLHPTRLADDNMVYASYKTVLNITLDWTMGGLPGDIRVSNYTANGVFASSTLGFPLLDSQFAGQNVSVRVYVSSATLGVTNALLTEFQTNVVQPPGLRSACPDRILSQVLQTIVVQGVGFVNSPSLACVVNDEYVFPATYSSAFTVTCMVTWPTNITNQAVTLKVANDGEIDRTGEAEFVWVTILGACESTKPGSVASPNGCICPTNTADTLTSCEPCATVKERSVAANVTGPGCMCPIGHRDDGNRCEPCENGSFQSQPGQFRCVCKSGTRQ